MAVYDPREMSKIASSFISWKDYLLTGGPEQPLINAVIGTYRMPTSDDMFTNTVTSLIALIRVYERLKDWDEEAAKVLLGVGLQMYEGLRLMAAHRVNVH